MPVYDDHPVRDLMRRANLRRIDLARAAGVTHAAVDKLMMGMTKSVHPSIGRVLAKHTGVPSKQISALVDAWNERPLLEKLPPRSQAMLALDPQDIQQYYASFRSWREEFAENPTQFASLLRVARATLVEYETDKRKVFPPALRRAIVRTFLVPEGYVDALAALPPSDAAGFEPTARIIEIGARNG